MLGSFLRCRRDFATDPGRVLTVACHTLWQERCGRKEYLSQPDRILADHAELGVLLTVTIGIRAAVWPTSGSHKAGRT